MNMSSTTQLPSKESALFKKILKCYEQKQYKMLLKFAKQILSNPKFSEHGETLAMKGLTLNCLGKKEEAYDCVKRGLKNALQSPVCWHVYGLLQRSDHKYDEAIRCYRNALKWNKDRDNLQILRDLSLLQIQMRDLEGYQETRYQLFKLRATQRASWIGFAMSYHLLNDYEMASNILDEFRKTSAGANRQVNTRQPIDYENSELVLYQVMIYNEGGKYQRALDHLNDCEAEICDKLSMYESKVDLYIKLNRMHDAAELLNERLISRNPDNRQYYEQLEIAMNIVDNEPRKHTLYEQLQTKYPRAQQPLRRPLAFTNDVNKFKELVDRYMRKSLRKGQPALFRDLKSLYKNIEKKNVIQQLMQQYERNLLSHLSFDDSADSTGSEDPCTLIWVRYFLAQHYCYFGDYELALQVVDKALLHTPTLIELYVLRGKVLKKQGELLDAVACLNEAQSLDTADRYLNSKCAKYMLRADLIQEAEQMCSKFTREGMDAAENLNEMQCMWFQTEAAHANYRLGQIGQALKKCVEIERHFAEMQEDQFDFHTYCMRKMTLRAYVSLLRLEDVLKNHPFYFKAAKLAIEIYLQLHDTPLPDYVEPETANKQNNSGTKMHPIENGHAKKSRKEKKQAKAEAEKQEQNKQSAANPNKDKSKEKEESFASTLHKEPLIPKDLERPKSALAEAERFLKPLQMLSKNRIDTHLLSFELYQRKQRPLLMLQSLKRAAQIDSNNETLHKKIDDFTQLVHQNQTDYHPNALQVINCELPKLQGGTVNPRTLGDYENSFAKLSLSS